MAKKGIEENAWVKLITAFFDVIKKAIPWTAWVLIAYFLAGRNTNISVIANAISDLKANEWIAYILGASGTGFGLRQRSLRRKEIQRYSNRVPYLEKELNSERTSSGLQPDGTQSEED
jgi:hypothetical protein